MSTGLSKLAVCACAAVTISLTAGVYAGTIDTAGPTVYGGDTNLTTAGTTDWRYYFSTGTDFSPNYAVTSQQKDSGNGTPVGIISALTFDPSAFSAGDSSTSYVTPRDFNDGTTFSWSDGLPGTTNPDTSVETGFTRYTGAEPITDSSGPVGTISLDVPVAAGTSGTLSVFITKINSDSTLTASIDGAQAYSNMQAFAGGFERDNLRYDFAYSATSATDLVIGLSSTDTLNYSNIAIVGAALSVNAVPEPTSMASLAAGAAIVLRRRRRRA